jgi:hypothetical protein
MTLTSGPHLSAAGAKKKRRKGDGRAGGEEGLGRCGPACMHALEKEADGPGEFAGCRKRRKREAGRGKWAAREEREREGGLGFFLFKFFSNSFFKLSNCNQTRNHAFES